MFDLTQITLRIDGIEVKVPSGSSVLDAARSVGISIPTLCHLADLTPEGACRMCVVHINGFRSLVASCVQPVTDGMIVSTTTPNVLEARKMMLELLLANHPPDCLRCPQNMDCQLQSLAADYGITHTRFPGENQNSPRELDNAFIVRDMDKCILCGRCVRVCQEMQACGVLAINGRSCDCHVAPAFASSLTDSTCVFCGACVSACPVGALTEKALRMEGRPDKKVRTTCPFCGVGCNFDLNVKNGKVIGVTSNCDSPVNGRLLCVKGRFGVDYIHSNQRLTTPLVRKNGKLEPASWDEALDFIATNLTRIKAENGSDSIAALSSARCTNEENYIIQKFMRAVIGTNSVDHCART